MHNRNFLVCYDLSHFKRPNGFTVVHDSLLSKLK